MTDIKMNPTTGAIVTDQNVRPGPAVSYDDAAVYKLTTPLRDGRPEPMTKIGDSITGLAGKTSTAQLRTLAAALVEHADAVDLFRSTYREAEWQVPDPKPVDVFPGFPLHLTQEVLTLSWPDGVRARDHEGDLWQFVVDEWRWVWVHPENNEPRFDNMARIEHNLPATVIPTSWPKAANTTPEN